MGTLITRAERKFQLPSAKTNTNKFPGNLKVSRIKKTLKNSTFKRQRQDQIQQATERRILPWKEETSQLEVSYRKVECAAWCWRYLGCLQLIKDKQMS
jgi:hypothetical protein